MKLIKSAPIATIDKPWGNEVWFAQSAKYVGKILTINKGHRLSRQYHKVKHETIYVLKGKLKLELNRKTGILEAGSAAIVPTKAVHRFEAPYGRVVLLEVSTPEVWDVVRLSDDYGRSPKEKLPAAKAA
jgi:quercetin dioxygenase-like cupin family protein